MSVRNRPFIQRKPWISAMRVDDNYLLISVDCQLCDYNIGWSIKDSDLSRWTHGELIQDVFPWMSPNGRELMISGVCGRCYDELMASVSF